MPLLTRPPVTTSASLSTVVCWSICYCHFHCLLSYGGHFLKFLFLLGSLCRLFGKALVCVLACAALAMCLQNFIGVYCRNSIRLTLFFNSFVRLSVYSSTSTCTFIPSVSEWLATKCGGMKILSPMVSGLKKANPFWGLILITVPGISSAADSATSFAFSNLTQFSVLGFESTYILNHARTSNI